MIFTKVVAPSNRLERPFITHDCTLYSRQFNRVLCRLFHSCAVLFYLMQYRLQRLMHVKSERFRTHSDWILSRWAITKSISVCVWCTANMPSCTVDYRSLVQWLLRLIVCWIRLNVVEVMLNIQSTILVTRYGKRILKSGTIINLIKIMLQNQQRVLSNQFSLVVSYRKR